MGWKLHPRVWVLFAIALVVELLSLTNLLPPLLTVEFIEIPWALVPVALALPFLPQRWPSTDRFYRGVAILLMACVVGSGAFYAALASDSLAIAVLATSVVEEVLFRLALPGLLMLGMLRIGVGLALSVLSALVISAVAFALMPGHVAQMGEPKAIAPFIAFAVLTSYAVWRGLSIWPAVFAHAGVDYFTLTNQLGYLTAEQRAFGVLACLGAMLFLANSRGKQASSVAPGLPTTIDLRDEPIVDLSDTPANDGRTEHH